MLTRYVLKMYTNNTYNLETKRTVTMTKMIRISLETAQNLDQLSKMCGMSRIAVLEKAVNAYLKDQFLIKANEEFAFIKANPDLWASEEEELKDWDIALHDGL